MTMPNILPEMDDRAISPIIGVVIVLAVVVGVGAIAGAAFLQTGASITSSQAPQISADSSTSGFSVESNYTITIQSGQSLNAEQLEVRTDSRDEPIPVTDLTNKDELSSGDEITISALEDHFDTDGDTIRLVWTDDSLTGGSSQVIYEDTIGSDDIAAAQGDIASDNEDIGDTTSPCGDLILTDENA